MPGGGEYGVPYGAVMGVASPPLWYASPFWSIMSGLELGSDTRTPPERLFFWRRTQKNAMRPMSARTMMPPTMPPTMGPVFDFFFDFPEPLLLLLDPPDALVGDGLAVPVCVVCEFVAVDSGAVFPIATWGLKMFVAVTFVYAHAGTPVPAGMSSGKTPT